MGEQDAKKLLSHLLQSLEDKSITPKNKLECLNKLLDLSKHVSDMSHAFSIAHFLHSLRPWLVYNARTMRAAVLKTIRYFLVACGAPFIKELIAQKMDYLIARCLEKDKHSEQERIQALKMIRAIMEVDCSQMPSCIMHSLVSCAENQEDAFCRVCLEALCEIAIRNPRITAFCNGMRLLFDSVLDPFYSGMQDSLVVAILYLLNDPSTRVYIRPKLDLQIILSPLTNTFAIGQPLKNPSKEKEKEKEKEDELNMKRWLACCKAVVSLLKSWTGIICLASDEQGLRSLVEALKMPSVELHDKVLDALYEIFRLSPPRLNDPFRNQQNTNNNRNQKDSLADNTVSLDLPSRTRATRHNLLNNYISILLIAFVDCGLVEGLIQLASNLPRDVSEIEKERSRAIAQKSTVLLGELLHFSNTLLPASQCARLQTLPALVNRAISFSLDPRIRSRASTMVTNLHAYSHIKATSPFADFYLSLIVTGANKWKRQRGKDPRLDKIDEVKMKMEWAIDEQQLRQRLIDSNVPATKDHQKWKWEVISELLGGALSNPVHLNTALRTKFIKRLLSFLRPSNRLFSTTAWNADNLRYVRIACQVLDILVSNVVGFEYLKDNKFLSSIGEMLKAEIDASLNEQEPPKLNASTRNLVSTRLLSPEKVLKTMAREYFTVLGTLSSTAYGLDIMSRNKIFSYLKPMAELPGRDDLSHLIMTSLDYNMAGESRQILAKALTSNSRVVRFLATRHLRVLLRAGVAQFDDWGIDFLVLQLNDTDKKVVEVALSVLDEACDEVECLEAVIRHRPPLLKHGKPGKNLMLRFLSTQNGLRYLKEINFIEKEMELWRREECVAYVLAIEANLSEALSAAIWLQRIGSEQSNNGVFLPPHFYGELAKTQNGCDILKKSGHFDQFMRAVNCTSVHSKVIIPDDVNSVQQNLPQIVANTNHSITPSELPALERRAALVTVAHIGSSLTGFSFLEQCNAIPAIIELCESSSCLSMRGTCIYALGMISRIEKAREIMEGYGWDSPADLSSCIAVPTQLSTNAFLMVPEYTYKGASPPFPPASLEGLNDAQKEVLSYVGKLSNHITADSASRNLKRLRTKHPEYFTSPEMILRVFQMMSRYRFRLGVRRFIYECFDPSTVFTDDNAILWDKYEMADSLKDNDGAPKVRRPSEETVSMSHTTESSEVRNGSGSGNGNGNGVKNSGSDNDLQRSVGFPDEATLMDSRKKSADKLLNGHHHQHHKPANNQVESDGKEIEKGGGGEDGVVKKDLDHDKDTG